MGSASINRTAGAVPGAEATRRLARAAVARWGAAPVHRVVYAVAWAIAGALSAIGLVVIVVWLPPGK